MLDIFRFNIAISLQIRRIFAILTCFQATAICTF